MLNIYYIFLSECFCAITREESPNISPLNYIKSYNECKQRLLSNSIKKFGSDIAGNFLTEFDLV